MAKFRSAHPLGTKVTKCSSGTEKVIEEARFCREPEKTVHFRKPKADLSGPVRTTKLSS